MFWRKKSYFDNSAPDIKNRRKQPCQVRYMAPIEQFFVTLNVATPDLFARFDKRKDRQKLRQAINPSAGMLRSGLKKTLQPCNQPGEVSNNKYICSSKKWSQWETVALWNSLVTWKLAQYLSDVTGSPTVNGGLSLVAVLLITNIHGSDAFPVLLPIDIENLHHYWNVVYR